MISSILIAILGIGFSGTTLAQESFYEKVHSSYQRQFETSLKNSEYFQEMKSKSVSFVYPIVNHNNQELLSDKMIQFRSALLACRTGSCINGLFKKLEKDYAAFEASADFNHPKYRDYRFFGARLLPGAKMAGYAWRMTKAVEKIRPVQEMLVAGLRSIAEEIKIHAPNSHNEAIFHYLTQPQEGYLRSFHTEKDVQDFYQYEVLPAVNLAAKRIEAIPMDQAIPYDQQLRFGTASFPGDHEKRYRYIGPAEKASLLARLWRRQAAILMFTAYDMSGYLKFRKEVGKRQGVDIMLGMLGQTGRITREDRVDLMKSLVSGESRSYYRDNMKQAYQALAQSVQYMNIAKASIDTEIDGDSLLEPEFFRARSDVAQDAINKLMDLTTTRGPVKLESALTGKTVYVNLYAYFNDPVKNFKKLLPTEYDHSGVEKPTTTIGGKSYRYRNYFYGRAIGWDVAEYRKIFPKVSTQDGRSEKVLETSDDIVRAMDLLSEARGGRMMANFLMPFVR